MHEYQVILYTEGSLSAFLPGGGRVDPQRFSAFINGHARKGWRVVTMEREQRRTLLFWSREAFMRRSIRSSVPLRFRSGTMPANW